MMELPARLVFRGSDRTQQLQGASIVTYGQQCGSAVAILLGSVGAQNVCAVTLSKAPCALFLSFHGGGMDRRISCSSSIWKRSSTNANASGEEYAIEQLWEEYVADPSQWWDNRADKRNFTSPDFKHKVTRRALWLDGKSTPPWAKAMLKLGTPDEIQPPVGYHTRGSQDTVRSNRALKNNPGKGTSWPTITRELRQFVQGDDAHMHMQSASTTREAISIMRNCLQQGITIDSYMYVEALQRCFKEKDLVSAKQVHDCVKKSGMEQNDYVANNLLRVYIRCRRLQDARQIFDKLVKKSVVSWTIMIGGYAQHDCAEDAIEIFNQMCQQGPQPNEITYLTILKACVSPVALKWAKEVHAHIRNAGFESDVRVGTALLKMYAKCGNIKEARRVFARLTNRNEITWNVMIGGLAEHGYGHEAYQHFLEMQRAGFVPDSYTYVSILNPSASAEALQWVKEVHMQALKAGLESNLRVGNSLVHMYAKSGSIDDARIVFNTMQNRDVITWNVMIGGLAEHGCGHEAYQHFLKMQRAGFVPDEYTYLSMLNPCAGAGALEWVKEVHMQAQKAGLESNLRVGNALVHMYVKSGSIDDARMVFNIMQDRDLITWNVMIGGLAEHGCGHEAYEHFLEMQRAGFVPNEYTYVSMLNPCASAGALQWVKEVDMQALKAGLELNLRVGNALVHMYAKSGSIDDACMVFSRMQDRDVITWTVMIGGLAEHGCGHEAYQHFLEMQRAGFVPNEYTYLSILNPCASAGALEWVKQVDMQALKSGLESNLRLGSALVHMYAKSGSIDDARVVFNRMQDRDVITWNVMIGGLAEHGCGHEAYEHFLEMQRASFVPNESTYVSILHPCASSGALEWVKQVDMQALKSGLESNLRVGSALVHMYANCGSINDARRVFNRVQDRDVITWNVMIGGLAEHGCGHEALQVYEKMRAEGIRPDGITFLSTLSACSHAGLVNEGRRLFSTIIQDYGFECAVEHYNCMVDLLGRAGHLEEAKLFIQNMPPEPNGATWGAFLGACRTYSNVELAELAAQELLKLEPKNASAYVLLSNVYAAAGKWGQVLLVRNLMQERGIQKEPGRSWIEVDNKIHHFVVGDTSHPEAKDIYAELNILAKKMKAEGYIPDTQLVLHNIDEEEKELALCSHSEKLAIAYGLMHTAPGKPIRIYKNLRVCSDCHTATKFISKVTGREIVARDANRFHHFKEGICSCGDYW